MSLSSTSKAYGMIAITALIIGAFFATVLVRSTQFQQFEELHRIGEERLNLYASTVEAEYQRFNYLPHITANDAQVLMLLSTPTNARLADRVNVKLADWQTESGADALYLMNLSGTVVASSNWQDENSFIGNDYHFRPYFIDAVAGNEGQFFAVGVTTGEPGLFLSKPVKNNDTVVGVAVLKIDMSLLEANWSAGGERVWISDSDGVIFLSSHSQWRYRSLSPLSPEVSQRIEEAQKYSNHQIHALPMEERPGSPLGDRVINLSQTSSTDDATFSSGHFLLHEREIPRLGWQLYYLNDMKSIEQSKFTVLLIALLVTALLALLVSFFFSRIKHQQQLEWQVAQRTNALRQSNSNLKREIEERIRTEKMLRQTNEELIHAEKMSALGQLSAELVHEISQPLQATLTYVASSKLLTKKGQYELVEENLGEVDSLIRRVSSIVTRLKTFASRSVGELRPVDLKQALDNALVVLQPRIDKHEIEIVREQQSECWVNADEIKLEQILVNLIRNAIDAIIESDCVDCGRITIASYQQQQQVVIKISDNGCGVSDEDLPMLFDSFFTTKPPGKGLGLGLSVSKGIIEEFGGTLAVENNTEQGAAFCVTLFASSGESNNE
ncbi:sensor histidine kinase [Vibrio sp. M260118]|uniref:sensor histidine kinase n=1 Tax=Vibrio sp. M260118 TaxID=3020896 RepID=UPI002F40531D